MRDAERLSRRQAVQALLGAGLFPFANAKASVSDQVQAAAPTLSSAEPSSDWNAPGPLIIYPEKVPLIQLTDRPVQLETPRSYFAQTRTPNAAFFVRWHLSQHPRTVDLQSFRLLIEGHVERPQALSFSTLVQQPRVVSLVAVCQCAGNSRSRFSPRVVGSQWGHGAMGAAEWTGVKLRDLLTLAGVKSGATGVQFEGLDRGSGPQGMPSARYAKTLDLPSEAAQEALMVYAMNGEPLPLLNGFPLRLVVPGYFATYWIKALSTIRVLDKADDGFWMKTAYRIPTSATGGTSPEEFAAGGVPTRPIGKLPVRSFLITPDGSHKLVRGLPVTARGVAFSGQGGIAKVECSVDEGKTWHAAQLGEDSGKFALRGFAFRFAPAKPGLMSLWVRATDGTGAVQRDQAVWNPGGYLWNRIEKQTLAVGDAA